jgi:hypothetical protein
MAQGEQVSVNVKLCRQDSIFIVYGFLRSLLSAEERMKTDFSEHEELTCEGCCGDVCTVLFLHRDSEILCIR